MWGATTVLFAHFLLSSISIHAPMWGATHFSELIQRFFKHFNPRTHVGCDKGVSMDKLSEVISIHAPMWGATMVRRHGMESSLFQSTHPCGVRQNTHHGTPCHAYFNPRTHVGCDAKVRAELNNLQKFQSTHPCGVRQYNLECPTLAQYFNPRTHVGCDLAALDTPLDTPISIHAPMWGATLLAW